MLHKKRSKKENLAIASLAILLVTVLAVVFIPSSDAGPLDDIYMTDQPGDQYIDERSNAVFTVSAVSKASYVLSYDWKYFDGATWKDVTEGVGMEKYMLVVSPSDYPDKTQFKCVISNGHGYSVESQIGIMYVGTVVHYVGSFNDLQRIGTGDWKLDHAYIQTATITFPGSTHTPIGTASSPFTGTYDGKGFAINGLKVDTTGTYAGLFGYAGSGAVLKNIFIMDGSVRSTAVNSYAGGIVGYAGTNTTITTCWNAASITSTSYAGGIAGYGVAASDCYNKGNILANGSPAYAGGIMGSGNRVGICYNYGEVKAINDEKTDTYAAGIIGRTHSNSTSVYNSFNYGAITADGTPGGRIIAAGISPGPNFMTYCHNHGTVSGIDTDSAFGYGSLYAPGEGYNVGQTYSNTGFKGLGMGIGMGGPYTWYFYLDTTGSGSGGRSSSSAEMKDITTYTSRSWNFMTVWTMDDKFNGGYPMLRVFSDLTDMVTHPADILKGVGMTASFSVTPDAYGTTYQWQIYINGSGWTDIPGANSASYSTSPVALADNGNMYRCLVTTAYDNVKSLASQPAKLTVVPYLHTISTDVDMTNDGPGTGGFVYEGGSVNVIRGDDVTFEFTTRTGFILHKVLVDGVNNEDAVTNGEYTFNDVDSNHTLVAVFAKQFTITTDCGPNGSITPPGPIKALYGETKEFVVTPDSGYAVSAVYLDGIRNDALYKNGRCIISNITSDHVLKVEFAIPEYQITLKDSPAGSGSFEYKINGGVWQTYTTPITVNPSNTLDVKANANSGYTFLLWTDTVSNSERSIDTDRSGTYTAIFRSDITSPNSHYIIATSDTGASISPNGAVSVQHGGNMRFTFSAVGGNQLSDVIIDGVSHPELITQGYYTFTNVTTDHTIEIRSQSDELTLEVTILEGKGYVEYSINNGAFQRYSGIVNIQPNDNIVLRAYADDGYKFKEWSGLVSSTNEEISILSVTVSVKVGVTFEESDTSLMPQDLLWFVGLVLIILAALLLLLLLFYRRSYKVIKVSSNAEIIGDEKARRKRPYRFTVDGEYEAVFYRIGKKDTSIPLVAEVGGTFVIPKQDVVGKITIEVR